MMMAFQGTEKRTQLLAGRSGAGMVAKARRAMSKVATGSSRVIAKSQGSMKPR